MRNFSFFLLSLLTCLNASYADERANFEDKINLIESYGATFRVPSEAGQRIFEISGIFNECYNSQVLEGNTREQFKKRICLQTCLRNAYSLAAASKLPSLQLPKKFCFALKAYEGLAIYRLTELGTLEDLEDVDIVKIRNEIMSNLKNAGLKPEDIGALPGELKE